MPMDEQEEKYLVKKYLKSIKKRDRYKCQNPECKGKKKGTHLKVHYIDYNKDNYAPWNLITLCLRCLTETRYNKAYSEAIYTKIVKLKYPNNWKHLQKPGGYNYGKDSI